MTAAELIAELSKLPPDAHVGISITGTQLLDLAGMDDRLCVWLLTDAVTAQNSVSGITCGTIHIS